MIDYFVLLCSVLLIRRQLKRCLSWQSLDWLLCSHKDKEFLEVAVHTSWGETYKTKWQCRTCKRIRWSKVAVSYKPNQEQTILKKLKKNDIGLAYGSYKNRQLT